VAASCSVQTAKEVTEVDGIARLVERGSEVDPIVKTTTGQKSETT
jgi:hypothetical protein